MSNRCDPAVAGGNESGWGADGGAEASEVRVIEEQLALAFANPSTTPELLQSSWKRIVEFVKRATHQFCDGGVENEVPKSNFFKGLAFVDDAMRLVAGDDRVKPADPVLVQMTRDLVDVGEPYLESTLVPLVSVLVKSIRKLASAVADKSNLGAEWVLQPIALRALFVAQSPPANVKLFSFLLGQLTHLLAMRLPRTNLVLEDCASVLDDASRVVDGDASFTSTLANFSAAVAAAMVEYSFLPESIGAEALGALLRGTEVSSFASRKHSSEHQRSTDFVRLWFSSPACNLPANQVVLANHVSKMPTEEIIALLLCDNQVARQVASRAMHLAGNGSYEFLVKAGLAALTAELASFWVSGTPRLADETRTGLVLARTAWAENSSVCVATCKGKAQTLKGQDLSACALLCFLVQAPSGALPGVVLSELMSACAPWLDVYLAGQSKSPATPPLGSDALSDILVECGLHGQALLCLQSFTGQPSLPFRRDETAAAVLMAVKQGNRCPNAALEMLGCALLGGWTPEQLCRVLDEVSAWSVRPGAHALAHFCRRLVDSGSLVEGQPLHSALSKLVRLLLSNMSMPTHTTTVYSALQHVLSNCGGLSDEDVFTLIPANARQGFVRFLRGDVEHSSAHGLLKPMDMTFLARGPPPPLPIMITPPQHAQEFSCLEALRSECASLTSVAQLRSLKASTDQIIMDYEALWTRSS